MKITYLIGNGFDINLGLKTRYVDFLFGYKEIKELDDDCIIDLKKSIQQYYDKDPDAMNWSDLELTLAKYTKHLQESDDPDLCMKKCLDDIRGNLAQYLIEQEKRLLDDIPKQIDSILYFWNDLTDITSGLRPDDKLAVSDLNNKFAGLRTVGFLNFNYTNVLDRMVQWIEKNLNPSLLSMNQDETRIAIGEMGKCKNTKWNFQNEWRYIIPILPFDVRDIDGYEPNIAKAFNELMDGSLQPAMDFYELEISEEAFKDITITTSPKMGEGNKTIVYSLVEKYNPSAEIISSSLEGLL